MHLYRILFASFLSATLDRPNADVDYTFIQVFYGVAGGDDRQDEMNTDCPRGSVTQ